MLTTLKFLNIGKQFPPKSERYRIKLYERNKLLYDGHHEYCLYNTKLYKSLKLNWFSRISTLWADLLVGEQPKFTTQEYNSDEQKQLDPYCFRYTACKENISMCNRCQQIRNRYFTSSLCK